MRTDTLVDHLDAALGTVQDVAREGSVVDDMQHDCRVILVGRANRFVAGACPLRRHHCLSRDQNRRRPSSCHPALV
jgi:hypothetical protein